jgi:flavorubredoxin
MIIDPYEVAPDTFVIQSYDQAPGAPVGVHLNSMVTRGPEPIIFDTGVAMDRDGWIDAVGSVVDFEDVRWIAISHDDPDHVGNLATALELAPNATVLSTWFQSQRLSHEAPIPPTRMRWVQGGESVRIADRELVFVRPPLYDNPTTRVVFDTKSKVLWAADLFATPVTQPTQEAADMPADALFEGFMQFQQWNSPWVELVDPARYAAKVAELTALDVQAIASTHGPAFTGAMVEQGFGLLRDVLTHDAGPEPGQPVLDEIVAQILEAANGAIGV